MKMFFFKYCTRFLCHNRTSMNIGMTAIQISLMSYKIDTSLEMEEFYVSQKIELNAILCRFIKRNKII